MGNIELFFLKVKNKYIKWPNWIIRYNQLILHKAKIVLWVNSHIYLLKNKMEKILLNNYYKNSYKSGYILRFIFLLFVCASNKIEILVFLFFCIANTNDSIFYFMSIFFSFADKTCVFVVADANRFMLPWIFTIFLLCLQIYTIGATAINKSFLPYIFAVYLLDI